MNRPKRHWIIALASVFAVAIVAIIIFASNQGSASATSETDPPTCTPSPAWDEEVFDHWQRYSWTGGPHASDDPPAFPSDDWQPNVQGDPHGIGHAGAYFVSHGSSGLGDWFYLEAVTRTIHHEEVVCPPPPPGDPTGTPTPTETPTEPPGDDPSGTPTPTPTESTNPPSVGTPTATTAPPTSNPPVNNPPVNNPPATNPPVKHPPVKHPTAVPTAIDAGCRTLAGGFAQGC